MSIISDLRAKPRQNVARLWRRPGMAFIIFAFTVILMNSGTPSEAAFLKNGKRVGEKKSSFVRRPANRQATPKFIRRPGSNRRKSSHFIRRPNKSKQRR